MVGDDPTDVPPALGGVLPEGEVPGAATAVPGLPAVVLLVTLGQLQEAEATAAALPSEAEAGGPAPTTISVHRLQLCEAVGGFDPDGLDWWEGGEAPSELPAALLPTLQAGLARCGADGDADWPAFALPGATAALATSLGSLEAAPRLVLPVTDDDADTPLRLLKAWSLSSVWISRDTVLKLAHPAFAVEPAITKALNRLAPGSVAEVLAVGELRVPGTPLPSPWVLQRKAGGQDMEGSEDAAGRLADALAEVQNACHGHEEELLSIGLLDRGPEATAAALEEVWASEELADLDEAERAALPRLDDLLRRELDELASLQAPLLLTHGDLHPGNALATPLEKPVIIDWTDACLSWPGVDLITMLSFRVVPEDEAAVALVARYANAIRGSVGDEAETLVARGLAMAPAFHALNYARIEAFRPPALRWDLRGAVRGIVRLMLRRSGLVPAA